MKKLLMVLLVVAATYTTATQNNMFINLSKTYSSDNREAYSLACSGATGKVNFVVEGLPTGVYLDGDRIVVGADTPAGNYVLRIRATDASGQLAQRIVNLGVVVVTQAGSVTGSTGAIGGAGSIGGTSGTVGTNGNNGGSGTIGGTGSTGTGGSTTSTTGVSSTTRLNQLLTTYSSITQISSPTYPNNEYPQPNFPTGNTVPSTNPTKIAIQTSQTTPTSDNRNVITADDVKLRAASQRHQNSIKAITNLLTIIDQARANKDKAEKDITTYTNAYNAAVTNQRSVQTQIYNIEIKVSQISSAINAINTEISKLNDQAGQIKGQYNLLIQRRTDYQSQINTYNNQKAPIQAQIDAVNTQINQYSTQLNANKVTCSSTSKQIDDNKYALAALQQKLQTLETTITTLTNLYNQKQALVQDLQKRLNAAIADRDSTKAQLDQAISDRTTLGPQITQLTNTISQLQTSYDTCNRQSVSIQQNIDTLTAQLNDLNKQIADIDARIQSIQQQISTLTIRITEIQSSNPGNNGKIAELQNQLAFLRQEFSNSQTQRNKLYTAGNDANNRVAFAKQNLEAVLARYKKESDNISQATLNLEKARSEQALARLAQEELIALYSNALPYAIVPNGNGNTNPGTPNGNNPSGSPLGPVAQTGGVSGAFTISSWTNYLSQAYGAGVNPAFSGSVTALYPFSFSSVVRGNNVYNNIRDSSSSSTSTTTSACNPTSTIPSASTTGVIVAVRDNSFDLQQNDGSVVTVNVAPCTSLNANKSGYKIQSGDIAVVKGLKQSGKVYNGQSVTCLAQE